MAARSQATLPCLHTKYPLLCKDTQSFSKYMGSDPDQLCAATGIPEWIAVDLLRVVFNDFSYRNVKICPSLKIPHILSPLSRRELLFVILRMLCLKQVLLDNAMLFLMIRMSRTNLHWMHKIIDWFGSSTILNMIPHLDQICGRLKDGGRR